MRFVYIFHLDLDLDGLDVTSWDINTSRMAWIERTGLDFTTPDNGCKGFHRVGCSLNMTDGGRSYRVPVFDGVRYEAELVGVTVGWDLSKWLIHWRYNRRLNQFWWYHRNVCEQKSQKCVLQRTALSWGTLRYQINKAPYLIIRPVKCQTNLFISCHPVYKKSTKKKKLNHKKIFI